MNTLPRVCTISRDPRSGRIVVRDENGQAIDSRHAVLGWLGVQILEEQVKQQGWRVAPAKEN